MLTTYNLRNPKKISILLRVLSFVCAMASAACGSGNARIVSQGQKALPPSPACANAAAGLKPALEQSAGNQVAFSAPLHELVVFPAIQKAMVVTVRPCDGSFTQLLIDNQVNPPATNFAYNQVLGAVRAFNGAVDSQQWSKLEWNPLSAVTVSGMLSCPAGQAGASAQEAIFEDLYSHVFSVALSAGFLDASNIIAGKQGYCALDSIAVSGVPLVYSCNQLDFACANNGSAPMQTFPGFPPPGLPNEQPTPLPSPGEDSPYQRLANAFATGRPVVLGDYPTAKEFQCAYSGKCRGKRLSGLQAPIRKSTDWMTVPAVGVEPVFHAPLTLVTRLAEPAKGPLIPAIPEESVVRESWIRGINAWNPKDAIDFGEAVARLTRMPDGRDRILPGSNYFQIVDSKKKITVNFREDTHQLIDACERRTPLAAGEVIAIDLPEGRTGSVGGTSVLVNRCRHWTAGMIFERIRIYDTQEVLLDTQYNYFWSEPKGLALLSGPESLGMLGQREE